MKIDDFKLERFFAQWEFDVPYVLGASDAETWSVAELLAMADDDARARWEELALGYTESAGDPVLRDEISRLYRSIGSENVLVFSGAQEAIFVLLNVLIGPNDHAVVVSPAYQSLYEVARAAGADISLVGLRYEDRWALDLDAVRDVSTPSTKVIVINYPHSPTGSLISHAEFDELVGIAEAAGAYLLCDEVYRSMELDESCRLPAGVDAYGRGISLGVMSKSFGMPGLRIGWLAVKDEALLERVAAFKDYTTICNSGPSEILAIAALRAGEAILHRNRTIVYDNLALLDGFFERNAEWVEWVPPASGTVAFPRLRFGGPVEVVAERLAREVGVLILPGRLFDYPGDHFRIGFGRSNFPEALERFEKSMAAALRS